MVGGPNELSYDSNILRDPNKSLPFGMQPREDDWEFFPEYFPDRLPQTKDKKLNRESVQCAGEDVTIETIKNRDVHVSGVVLAPEIDIFQTLTDYDKPIDLYTPLLPYGGMECIIKNTEIDANPDGFDAYFRQWRFSYTIDLVSTGYDEYDTGDNERDNEIVSAIIEE